MRENGHDTGSVAATVLTERRRACRGDMMQWARRVGKVAVVLLGAGGLTSVLFGMSEVRAEGGRPFVGTAVANGMYVRYGIPGFLLVDNYIDGGGPVAQATFGSDGVAQSYASLPEPGPAAATYPAAVALVTGTAPPGYPFSVAASHPTQPDSSLADPSGTYALKALANEKLSSGDARMSPGAEEQKPIIRAHSQVIPVDDGVSATAQSRAEGISLGPLSLGLVRSQSVTTYRQGGKPVTTTELVVEGGRAGDANFTFGRDGLDVAQQGIPLPADQGLTTLNQALAPAGLSLHFQEAKELTGGAVAAAVEVVSVADVPGAGKGKLSVIFGGATSFVSLGAESDSPESVGGSPLESDPQPTTDPTAPNSAPAGAGGLDPPSPSSSGGPLSNPASGYETENPAPLLSNAGYAHADPVGPSGAPPGATLALPAAGLATAPLDLGATSILAGLLLAGGVGGAAFIASGAMGRRRPWMG